MAGMAPSLRKQRRVLKRKSRGDHKSNVSDDNNAVVHDDDDNGDNNGSNSCNTLDTSVVGEIHGSMDECYDEEATHSFEA